MSPTRAARPAEGLQDRWEEDVAMTVLARLVVPLAILLALSSRPVAADPIRASAMGEAARQRVEQEYSIEKAVSGTLAALESVKRFAPSRG